MSLGDFFPKEQRIEYLRKHLQPRQIFYLFCDFINPQKNKYLILVCINPKPLFFLINSGINPYIIKREHLLKCQILLEKSK
jgi:hypothetical protein